jgi:hypothetical protein
MPAINVSILPRAVKNITQLVLVSNWTTSYGALIFRVTILFQILCTKPTGGEICNLNGEGLIVSCKLLMDDY